MYQQWPVKSEQGCNLLAAMLEYDPLKRITAEDALNHPYFQEDPRPGLEYVFLFCLPPLRNCFCLAYLHLTIPTLFFFSISCFVGKSLDFPTRRITNEDKDMRVAGAPQKTHPVPPVKDDRTTKRPRVE